MLPSVPPTGIHLVPCSRPRVPRLQPQLCMQAYAYAYGRDDRPSHTRGTRVQVQTAVGQQSTVAVAVALSIYARRGVASLVAFSLSSNFCYSHNSLISLSPLHRHRAARSSCVVQPQSQSVSVSVSVFFFLLLLLLLTCL